MRNLLLMLTITVLTQTQAFADPTGHCAGTPKTAIVDLPPPLSDWGHIECTPYGHVIAANKGWLWTNPGAYAPVFIPSQMVKENPQPLGNKMYFSVIKFEPATTEQAKEALAAFRHGLDTSEQPVIYHLFLKSISGDSLTMYFLDFPREHHTWGMWCPKQCKSDSRFMILDKSESPSTNSFR